MEKHLFKELIALVLVTVMLAIMPARALAQSNGTEYISELCVASNSNSDAAKKELTDKGFKVIDNNVNAGTEKDYVYIGYKTTTDTAQAITDVRVMDMKGGYSVSDYNQLLQDYEEKITKELNGYKKSINEFRELYNDGDEKAIYAYKQLNKLKEDDTGKLMGDLFIEQELDIATLTKVFVQGNPQALKLIEQAFAIVYSDEWLQLAADNTANDYSGSTDLDQACADILANWSDLQLGLYSYYQQKDSADGYDMSKFTEDSFKTWKEKNAENADSVFYFGVLYEILVNYKTKDGSNLAELFTKDSKDVTYDDLYPIADALSEGALQAMKYVGLQNTVVLNDCDVKQLEKAETEKKDEIDKLAVDVANKQAVTEDEKITVDDLHEVMSVYSGVDRTMFDKNGGIALTNDALRSKASTKDTIGECIISKKGNGIIIGASVVCFCAGTVAMVIAYSEKVWASMHPTLVVGNPAWQVKVLRVGGGILYGLAVGALAAAVVRGVLEYYHPTYTVIPRAIVDEVKTETKGADGKKISNTNYIAYYAVFDAEDTGGENRKYGDLNGWGAHQWNALYTTKDQRAGVPITADILVQFGNSEAPSGYSPVRYFGSNNTAYDLNKHAFKSEKGIF